MKKIIAALVAIAAGALVFSKVRASRSENDLWHDATKN
ncbi:MULTISPECIES: DLW-39 family protein [Pseudonocardia]|uniref:DLW-39 family protein n=2 Tax=Pseudonocardia TaxID=1847 RepID=A0ABS9TQI6_9PSEU|nr:DLW-39 family protein [Pseudonocardia alaniniphila]MCH6170805.1 DLW-39 family protein [Pseudonocardia alaniniphila]HET6741393.1 DLW-39 family protein [Kribbella sp.]